MMLKKSIEERPSVINKRERLGDWEIDCIFHQEKDKSAL